MTMPRRDALAPVGAPAQILCAGGDLQRIDVALLREATQQIDIAAYVLRKRRRGPQAAERNARVLVRAKGDPEAKMLHVKSLSLAFALIAGVSIAAFAKTEKEFISDAIKGDNSEIAMGQLAISKSASDPVKAFGQTLIDDHSKAKTDASAVAETIGVSPPKEMSPEAQRDLMKLQKLSGREFDREFARVMVEDHQKDIAEFKDEAAGGHGPVQQLAAQTLSTLEKHLQMAKSLSAEK